MVDSWFGYFGGLRGPASKPHTPYKLPADLPEGPEGKKEKGERIKAFVFCPLSHIFYLFLLRSTQLEPWLRALLT
jgi:hypothetical protein